MPARVTRTLRRTEGVVEIPTDEESPSRATASHTKLESTVRYPGIEVDDALEISEQTEV
jgi:hypothetical protein